MSKSPVGASSATYRTAVNEIADAIKTEPNHGKYPSDDLLTIIDEIPEAMREMALEWYTKGIKRGMRKATDLMVDGSIYKKGNTVYAPNSINMSTQIKALGGDIEKKKIIISASDIGFK